MPVRSGRIAFQVCVHVLGAQGEMLKALGQRQAFAGQVQARDLAIMAVGPNREAERAA